MPSWFISCSLCPTKGKRRENTLKRSIMKKMLYKIEGLIVDGQKEVLDRIDKVESSLSDVKSSLRDVESTLRQEIRETKEELEKKIDQAHSSLKSEISTTAKILDFGIKEVGHRLDEHLRVAV